jgi:hypothetical protein
VGRRAGARPGNLGAMCRARLKVRGPQGGGGQQRVSRAMCRARLKVGGRHWGGYWRVWAWGALCARPWGFLYPCATRAHDFYILRECTTNVKSPTWGARGAHGPSTTRPLYGITFGPTCGGEISPDHGPGFLYPCATPAHEFYILRGRTTNVKSPTWGAWGGVARAPGRRGAQLANAFPRR